MAARLLLTLLAVVCQVRGNRILYDTGASLISRADSVSTTEYTDTVNSRRFCFSGSEIYFATGNSILRVSTTTTFETVATEDYPIASLSCACDLIAYTFRDTDSGCTYLVFGNPDDLGDICIRTKLDCGTGSPRSSAVSVEKETNKILAVTRNTLFVTGFDFLNSEMINASFSSSLTIDPRCVAGYLDGEDWTVFVSTDQDSDIREIFYNATANSLDVFDRTVLLADSTVADVACLDICGDRIYILQQTDSSNFEVRSYNVGDISEATPYNMGTANVTGISDNDLDDDVNGLNVFCPGSCSVTCNNTCDCNSNCGFCVGVADVAECQCESSNTDYCNYKNSSLATTCAAFEETVDAYCAIQNPLGQRRRPLNGNPIDIVGVASVAATITVNRRTAKTGRWVGLPTRTNIGPVTGTDGLWYTGFRAVIQSSARGKRFGVFEAVIDPDDPDVLTENINCIVTENSGFYNRFYTYTRVVGGSVTLSASANTRVSMLLSQLRWWFQRIDQSTNMPTGSKESIGRCSGSLTCTFEDLEKEDEGIYEVSRLNIAATRRKRRSWHPIFYLYVRECSRNTFGMDCTGTCSGCVHGYCDRSGTCICLPGFTGDTCEDVCPVGFVGQECDISCSDLFAGNDKCWDILFCQPNKMGCHCSTGRDPPSCQEECVDGKWGPNCELDCPGGASDCDPRDGSV